MHSQPEQQVMPDDHSKVVPLLPIPNRTVKRLCADDSADSRVKVGHRQALIAPSTPSVSRPWGFWRYECEGYLSAHTSSSSAVGLTSKAGGEEVGRRPENISEIFQSDLENGIY